MEIEAVSSHWLNVAERRGLDPSQCWLSGDTPPKTKRVRDPDGGRWTLVRVFVAVREGLDYEDLSWDTRHLCPGGSRSNCWNPAHVDSGTRHENMLDMLAEGRARGQGSLTCENGHLWEGNTEFFQNGARTQRRCITCRRARNRGYEAAARERRRSQ